MQFAPPGDSGGARRGATHAAVYLVRHERLARLRIAGGLGLSGPGASAAVRGPRSRRGAKQIAHSRDCSALEVEVVCVGVMACSGPGVMA